MLIDKYRKKSFPIELLRVVACCMVITIHTHLPDQLYEGCYDRGLTLLSCLIGDAVAIFWMIGGCFAFTKPLDYPAHLKKTFRRIAVPLLLMTAFVFYFRPFLLGAPLAESVRRTPAEHLFVLKALLSWSNPFESLNHLWYLYTYLLLMVAFPVLYAFAAYLDAHPAAERGFCLVTLLLFCMNDLRLNGTFFFSHHGLNAAVPAAVEMLWGHIVYKNRERLRFRPGPALWLALFFALMLLRWRLQLALYAASGSNYLLYWYTAFGIACTACLLLAFLQGFRPEADTPLKAAVCYLGECTFYIYLIHMLVYRDLLGPLGFNERVYQYAMAEGGFTGKLLHTAVMTLTVFLLSLLLVSAWKLLSALVGRIAARIRGARAA